MSNRSSYKVVCIETPPWMYSEIVNGITVFRGPLQNMIADLSEGLNFDYEIIRPPKKVWGMKLPNGSWTGMMGLLHRGEADFTLMPAAHTLERMAVFDFSRDFYTSYATILAGGTGDAPKNLFGYFMTFDMEVWIGLFISMMLLILVSLLVDWTGNNYLSKATNTSDTMSYHFWNYMAALLFEATPKSPRRETNKFLLAVWLLATLILVNAFTGNFKSSLMVVTSAERIESVEDLANRKKVDVLTWGGSVFEYLLRQSKQEAVRKVAKRLFKTGEGLLTLKELYSTESFTRVQDGKAAIITETSTIKSQLAARCSSLKAGGMYLAKEPIQPLPLILILNRKLPTIFKNALNRRLQRYVEADLLSKWLEDMYVDWRRCTIVETQQERTLGFEDLQAVFFLWLLSLLLAVLVFLGEFTAGKVTCRSKKKTLELSSIEENIK